MLPTLKYSTAAHKLETLVFAGRSNFLVFFKNTVMDGENDLPVVFFRLEHTDAVNVDIEDVGFLQLKNGSAVGRSSIEVNLLLDFEDYLLEVDGESVVLHRAWRVTGRMKEVEGYSDPLLEILDVTMVDEEEVV